jgi:hypothetical protein
MITRKSQGKSIASNAPVEESLDDPTVMGSKRARGISSLILGEKLIYGLGCDSR